MLKVTFFFLETSLSKTFKNINTFIIYSIKSSFYYNGDRLIFCNFISMHSVVWVQRTIAD